VLLLGFRQFRHGGSWNAPPTARRWRCSSITWDGSWRWAWSWK
jgi:hypothetical protein